MSQPDYDQYAEDHQCLLVLVKLIGPQLEQNLYSQIYDRISRNYEFKIQGKQDETFERTIRIRFRQSYSTENNDWGDFQAHRKLLGLITVARSFNDNEIESITELHNTIRLMFDKTLYDSRCFILRSKASTTSIPLEDGDSLYSSTTATTTTQRSQSDENNRNEDDESLRNSEDEGIGSRMGGHSATSGTDCDLFDFHLGERLLTNNETGQNSFATRINRSSSSNSLSNTVPESEHNSPPATPTVPNDSQPGSLPHFLQVPSTGSHQDNVSVDRKYRTHSRNKSLDSRLLAPLPVLESDNTDKTKSDQHLQSPKSSSSGDLKSSLSSESLMKRTASGMSSASDKNCCEFFDFDHEDMIQNILEAMDEKVREFLSGLFWVLESKRLAKARDINEKTPALMSPFEEKDSVGLDTETKNYRKKCMARMHKHVGDLCLQAGLPREALFYYIHATDQLKSAGDRLWNAAALEAFCACSIILTYPRRFEHINLLRKQFRLEEKTLFEDLIQRSDYDKARREFAEASQKYNQSIRGPSDTVLGDKVLSKNILAPEFYYDKYKEAVSLYAMYRHAAIIEFECSLKAARVLLFLQQTLKASDFVQNAVFTSFEQSIDQQVERLLKVSNLYEQMGFFRKAAFYKRSAAVKCVKSHQAKSLEHCYFLLLVSSFGYGLKLDPSEYDKAIQRNDYQWSKIHVQLLQEMFTLADRMKNPTLAMRHLSFMMQCLFNFITPSQREQYSKKLLELSTRCGEGSPVALKLNNGLTIPSVNFTKFPCLFFFKVEPLSLYLRPFLIKNNDSGTKLKKSSSKKSSSSKNIAKKSSDNCSKVVLLTKNNTEHVNDNCDNKSIQEAIDNHDVEDKKNVDQSIAKNEIDDLEVIEEDADDSCEEDSDDDTKEDKGPFIYSALKHSKDPKLAPYGPQQRPGVNKVSLYWCQDALSRITINLHNFLPVDLRISSIMALTDGLAYEPKHDTNLKIKASSTLENVYLAGTPRAPGILEITGYRVHALGLKSDCRLSELPTAKRLKLPNVFQVQVVPKLPMMSAEVLEVTSQDYCSRTSGQDCHVSSLCRVPIYSGERRKFTVQLLNVSPDERDLIEYCKMTLSFGQNSPAALQKMITVNWSQADINKGLPFVNKLLFDIELEANDGFMVSSQSSDLSRNSSSVLSRSSGVRDKLLGSSRLASFINELQTKKSEKIAQEAEKESEKQSLVETKPELFFKSKFVELFLEFEYSGTDGYKAGFCRRTSVCMNLEILPSALITYWDVLQAEQPDECYIVLDIFNASETEMNLHYAEGKDIAVESQDKCRIPVPVRRLPSEEANKVRLKLAQCADNPGEMNGKDFSKISPDRLEDAATLKALSDACREELWRQIDLKWMLSNGDNGTGFVSIRQVPFSDEMMRILLTPLIHGDVYFNNTKHSSSNGEVEIGLGEQLLIRVDLKCSSSTDLRQLRLFAVTFQDYCSGTKKSLQSMTDRVLVNGTDSINIPKLNSDGNIEHEFGYIFLCPGFYRMNVCCIPEEQYRLNSGNLLEIDVSLSTASYLQTFDINVLE